MGTFVLVVLAIALLAVVFAIAYSVGKRRGRKPAATYTDDPTGYVPGLWYGDSATPGHHRGQQGHGHGQRHGHRHDQASGHGHAHAHGQGHDHGHAQAHAHHSGGHDAGGGDAGSDGGGGSDA